MGPQGFEPWTFGLKGSSSAIVGIVGRGWPCGHFGTRRTYPVHASAPSMPRLPRRGERARGRAPRRQRARTRIDGPQRLAARGSRVARDSPPGSRARGSRPDARRPARPDGSPDRRPGRGAARPRCGARGRTRRALGAAGAGRGRGAPRRHRAPGGGRRAGTRRRRDAPAALPFPRASPSPRCPHRIELDEDNGDARARSGSTGGGRNVTAGAAPCGPARHGIGCPGPVDGCVPARSPRPGSPRADRGRLRQYADHEGRAPEWHAARRHDAHRSHGATVPDTARLKQPHPPRSSRVRRLQAERVRSHG